MKSLISILTYNIPGGAKGCRGPKGSSSSNAAAPLAEKFCYTEPNTEKMEGIYEQLAAKAQEVNLLQFFIRFLFWYSRVIMI